EGGIHQLIEEQVQRTPEALALVFQQEKLTYQQLNQRANRLAHLLRKQGVGEDVLVGICMERSIEMVLSILAILKAGGAYVPLDPTSPPQRLQAMVEDAQAALILVQPHLRERLAAHQANCLSIQEAEAAAQQEPETDPESVVTGNSLAYMIY